MPILIETSITTIDGSAIRKGDAIRAQYHTWESAVNGIVAGVTEERIRVLYIGSNGNISNYFTITVQELEDNKWSLIWSSDFETINWYPSELNYEPNPIGGTPLYPDPIMSHDDGQAEGAST